MAAHMFRDVAKSLWKLNYKECIKRTLYSASALGIDGYVAERERVAKEFQEFDVRFKERLKDYLKTNNRIFTEDINTMMHLTEKKDDDIHLCLEMLKRYNAQTSITRFGKYRVGPLVMRMFYYLKKPEIALKLLQQNEFNDLFQEPLSFQILMDSLYKKGKHNLVIDAFDIFKNKNFDDLRRYNDCINLVCASCYKLNSDESLDYSVQLLKQMHQNRNIISRKSITFVAALALIQNDPSMALEILVLTNQKNYVTVKNIRLIALCKLNRLDEILTNLKYIITADVPDFKEKREQILLETIETLKSSMKQTGSKEILSEFLQIEKALRDSNQVSEKSLDEVLCSEILPPYRFSKFEKAVA